MNAQNSNMIKIAVVIALTAIVVGGVYKWQKQGAALSQPAPSISVQPATTPAASAPEPLSYSTTGVAVTVSKETKPTDFSATSFAALANSCGTTRAAGYFDQLEKTFKGTSKTIYNFKYNGESQESDTYNVTLLPNAKGYTSLNDFKKDFDICDAGGDAYPKLMNENWLLFVNSCGSGYSDDSGRPIGCDMVRTVVEPTLKLN